MPEPGDIGVVCIKGNVGLLIRIGQWLNGSGFKNYEHAFVYLGHDNVVEGQPEGARLGKLSKYDSVLWLHCPAQFRLGVAKAALGFLGTPYSWADYFALAAVRLHLFPLNILLRRYVASSGHMICSQLADQAARKGGWHIFTDGRPSEDVTPADLANIAEVWK